MTSSAVGLCALCRLPGRPLHGRLTDRLHDTLGHWNLVECTSVPCSGLAWVHPRPSAESLAHAYGRYFTCAPRGSPSRLRRLYLGARRARLARRFSCTERLPALSARMLGAVLGPLPHPRAAVDARVLRLGPVRHGRRLLEIGCGNGDLLAHLASPGWQGRELETDPKDPAIARVRGLDVTVGALTHDAAVPASFDALVKRHVFEHVGSPQTTLARCLPVLGRDGRFFLLTPNTAACGHRRFGRDWLHSNPPRDLRLFSARSLCHLAVAAGFANEPVFAVPRGAHWTLGASQRLREADRYMIGKSPPRLRTWSLALLAIERRRMRADPLCGDEVVLTTCKP